MTPGGHDAQDRSFEAGLESTLRRAVDHVTSSPDLRTTIEHAAAQELSPTGPSAFAEVDAARPGPELRARVVAAVSWSDEVDHHADD